MVCGRQSSDLGWGRGTVPIWSDIVGAVSDPNRGVAAQLLGSSDCVRVHERLSQRKASAWSRANSVIEPGARRVTFPRWETRRWPRHGGSAPSPRANLLLAIPAAPSQARRECVRRDVDERHITAYGSADRVGDLGVGHRRRTGDGVGRAFMAGFAQSRCRNGGDVPDVDRADPSIADRGKELAVLADRAGQGSRPWKNRFGRRKVNPISWSRMRCSTAAW